MKGFHLAEVFENAVLVVAKLDRLVRSVADAAIVIADFDKKDIQLVPELVDLHAVVGHVDVAVERLGAVGL
jgi:hypothetical protein